jgi:glycine hydroxymethyltransferase
MKYLQTTDSEIYDLIKKEEKRQQETLMMIPSENIASEAVNEAVGSVLGNKYAEGYPGKRYYQGQSIVDQVELLAIERAKNLFGVAAVNVQPHSGSPANFAVYTALLNPGETLMGLNLASGGHLTHGATFNASSKYFNSVPYDVDENGMIDYDAVEKQAKKEKPKIIVAGTTAYARFIDWARFAEIAEKVGAYLMADISHISGLVVTGVYPSPVPYVHVVTTTTHKTLRGPRGAMIMTTQKGLDKDPELAEKINKAIIPGIQGGPHLNSIAGIAVALKEASKPSFKTYAKNVVENAQVLADELMKYDFKLVTGGTDCHLVLVDLRNKNILGNTAAEALEAVNIVLNRNGVPHDTNPPFYPSGIRMGTPGITSRGMKKKDMKVIAKCMNDTIVAVTKTIRAMKIDSTQERKRQIRQEIIANTKELPAIRKEILALCKAYPILKTY